MMTLRPSWSRIGGVLVSLALVTMPFAPTVAYAAATADKSETVHVNTDATGAITDITVEEVLENSDSLAEMTDKSNLSDIVASEDDVSFVASDDGGLTWTTGGKDVSYEGTSSDVPPVEVSVSYTLDGAPADPKELAGASGHLVVRVDYKNTLFVRRTIGGKKTRVYTPFVCMTAAILDGEVFRNVTVENGKLIEDKGGLAVVGYALPGLRESLDLDPDDLDVDFPEYVQIEADVTDLALDPIYTIVTPELLSDLDTSDLDFGDLGDGTDELKDAMSQLIDGSGALTDGLNQIADGSGQLGGGVRALREALGQLPDGLSQLTTGAQTLSSKLGEASGVASQLSEGASGLVEAADSAQQLVGGAQGDVGSASGAVSELQDAVGGLDLAGAQAAANEAADAANAAKDAATEAKGLLDGASSGVEEQKAAVAGDLDGAQGALDGLLADEGLELTPEQRAVLEGRLAAASEQLAGARSDLDAIHVEAPEGLNEKAAALEGAAKGLSESAGRITVSQEGIETVSTRADAALGSLDAASSSLDASYEYLGGVAQGARNVSAGANGIASGLEAAATGAGTLSKALEAFAAAAPQALTGIGALSDGSDQLTMAISAAADGSDQLTSALSTFNDEGISKIVDALNDLDHDLNGASDRLDALRDAARSYDNFAGKADGASGSVRFIYKTEQIG